MSARPQFRKQVRNRAIGSARFMDYRLGSREPSGAPRILRFSVWCINETPADVAVAFAIEDSAILGFWDALMIASAAKAGATTLLSEDLYANQTVTRVRIENPFA